MREFALTAILLLAAGCAQQGPPPETLPEDWKSGAPLLAYERSGTHSGAAGANLYFDGALDQPATCAAYRDDARDERDTCEVREPKYSWEEKYDWVVIAYWAGCPGGSFEGCPGEREAPYKGRVVAYDTGGYTVAWWDGAEGPNMMYVTE